MVVPCQCLQARLAQSAERKALNLVVVGSSPTVGVLVPDTGDTNESSMQLLPQAFSVKVANSTRAQGRFSSLRLARVSVQL